MKISCVLCEKEVNTKNEEVYMTVEWCFGEMLKLNNINLDKDFSRVISICSDCWINKLPTKLEKDNYYWVYNKEI